MKTIIVVIIIFLSFCSVTFAEDKKQEPKKFEVIFTVRYNEMTLGEAAEKEKEFRKLFKDACDVDVALSEIGSGYISVTSRAYIFTDEQQ